MKNATSGPPGGRSLTQRKTGAVKVGIAVTGDEVHTGYVPDRNGGPIAQRLIALGCELLPTTILPDDQDLLNTTLAWLIALGADAIVMTGGRGSTLDDRTAAAIEELLGDGMVLDEALLERIRHQRQPIWHGGSEEPWRAQAERRQAMIPRGALWIGPATRASAAALIVPPSEGRPLIIALPGVPREVRELLPQTLASAPARQVIAGGIPRVEQTMRFWGIDEAEVDATLRSARETGLLEGIRTNLCFAGEGRSEVWAVSSFAEHDVPRYARLEAIVRAAHGPAMYSTDGRTVEELLAPQLRDRTVAVVDTSGTDTYQRLFGRAGHLRCENLDGSPSTLAKAVGLTARELDLEPEWRAQAIAFSALRRWEADIGVGLWSSRPGVVHVATESRTAGRILRTVSLDDQPALASLAATFALHEIRELLAREQHG